MGSGGHNLPLLQHKVFVDREQYFHQQQFVWDQMGTGQMSSTWQIWSLWVVHTSGTRLCSAPLGWTDVNNEDGHMSNHDV